MPRLASFDGVVVKMYFGDHPPPHFHAYVGRIGHAVVRSARFSIETGEVIEVADTHSEGRRGDELVGEASRHAARRL